MRGARKATIALAAAAAAAGLSAIPAQATPGVTCTWAGTPVAPTGTFWVTPGVTNSPSSGPLKFLAVGRLGGGARCHGTMKFVGQLDAGATCPYSTFRGRVYGLRGVRRYLGHGSLDVPSQLFDRRGRFVGVENANIMTQANLGHTLDCATPGGFAGGWPAMFSSVVTLFAR
jgi:hypothetical protein